MFFTILPSCIHFFHISICLVVALAPRFLLNLDDSKCSDVSIRITRLALMLANTYVHENNCSNSVN